MTALIGYRSTFFTLFLVMLSNHSIDTSLSHEKPTYLAPHTTSEITIDGVLDESLWKVADRSSTFIDLVSCERLDPLTYFQAGYDNDYLYIGVYSFNPNITATITEENQRLFLYDPTIEVFLDPQGDGLNYYELQINPNNARWQLSLSKPVAEGGQAKHPDMMPGLLSQVHIEGTINDNADIDQYWTAEIALPWSGVMKYSDNYSKKDWSINVGLVQQPNRSIDKAKYFVWSCAGAYNMHKPTTWGNLKFGKK